MSALNSGFALAGVLDPESPLPKTARLSHRVRHKNSSQISSNANAQASKSNHRFSTTPAMGFWQRVDLAVCSNGSVLVTPITTPMQSLRSLEAAAASLPLKKPPSTALHGWLQGLPPPGDYNPAPAIAFTEHGERLVGLPAKRQAVVNSANTVFAF